MAAFVETRAPRHVSNYTAVPTYAPSTSRGRSSTGGLLDRINAAEVRSVRPRSHSRSLVLKEHHHHHRSVDEINAEIAALEAESRANHLQRKVEKERELAEEIRDYSPSPERIIVDDRRHHHHHHHHRRSRDDVVLLERSRERSRLRDPDVEIYERRSLDSRRPREEVEIYERRRPREEVILYERSRSRPRDEYIYERRKSPVRNVVRVEKDRKGRLALVKSSR